MINKFRTPGIPDISKVEPKKKELVPTPGAGLPPALQTKQLPPPQSPTSSQDRRTDVQRKAAERREHFLSEARKIADVTAVIENLEETRAKYLTVIKDAGLKINMPVWGAVKEKIAPFGISKQIREGKRIKNNLGRVSVGKNEAAFLTKYRDWLLGRVGEKIGGNQPGTRPAGIEKRLADVLRNSFGIDAEPAKDPKVEAERGKRRTAALKALRGLKIEEPPLIDRLQRKIANTKRQRAWIYRPPLSLVRGYFFLRADAEPKDILQAIEEAFRKKKSRRKKKSQKIKSSKKR